ncbi:histidine kinase [Micromonospora sp. NPDC049559]|uniref:sensor histidine kinase n=1 Tax=Micromonospora sp. NPDC049559 TaxID=3155923 RepID=UPI0034184E14
MHRLNLWLRGHPWVVDLALIAALSGAPPMWLAGGWRVVVLAALLLPILFRRRYPVTAAAIVLGAAWLGYLLSPGPAMPMGYLALVVILYTLVMLGRRREASLMALASAGFFLTWTLTRYTEPDARVAGSGFLLLLVTAWLLGEFVRARQAYLAEVERRAALADSERQALARAAAADERTRIARELHDVLAHSVSVMVVNAEGAKLARHTDPEAVDRTLEIISRTGRSTLAELRRLLEVLHAQPVRRPQPTLADLEQLVTRAGLGRPPITLTVTGDGSGLPASAGLQIYRIVQEALTNVLKHAPVDATARVSVDYGMAARRRVVRVEVTNSGGGAAPPPGVLPSSRLGLAGMRERVAMFDGTLDAGPTAAGGYRLAATLRVDGDGCLFGGPAAGTNGAGADGAGDNGPGADAASDNGPGADAASGDAAEPAKMAP